MNTKILFRPAGVLLCTTNSLKEAAEKAKESVSDYPGCDKIEINRLGEQLCMTVHEGAVLF